MKYGEFCASIPYFILLRFVSSFCGSLFVNLRFHWILGKMPVNGLGISHSLFRRLSVVKSGARVSSAGHGHRDATQSAKVIVLLSTILLRGTARAAWETNDVPVHSRILSWLCGVRP